MNRLPVLQKNLCRWFEKNRRPLPWRVGYDPYQVWISEIMLQQTQMERGVAYFSRWVARFPDVASVAAADEEDVLHAWEGLGYYSRARNLHRAARDMVRLHQGRVPDDLDLLLALPGVGAYTARAIMSLAFNHDLPVVDANVERVCARLFDVDAPAKAREGRVRIHALAGAMLPPGRARDWNQAVMEFGALVCGKKPACGACPVAGQCEALRLGIVADRPILGRRKEIVPLMVTTGVLLHQGRLFIQKRLPKGAWAGLWEFPGGRIEPGETPEAAVVREFAEETGFSVEVADTLGVVRHGYTTYRVALHCHLLRLRDGAGNGGLPVPDLEAATAYRWATLAELGRYAFPAGHRKLIDALELDPRLAGA
ncbi:MAG: A/G-specific adenine glycosylase [Desulfovibrionaceae bacterium]